MVRAATEPRARRVITSARELWRALPDLAAGDVVVGRVPMRPGQERLLAVLAERGVCFVPSLQAQLLSRSKALQAAFLADFMVPGTSVLHCREDLLALMGRPGPLHHGEIVVKRDQGNAGGGVFFLAGLESLFTHLEFAQEREVYPVVVQPMIEDAADMRVVVLGEELDVYQRHSACSRRRNLHCGGTAQPVAPDEALVDFCRQVMRRAGFPYGCLDLLRDGSGRCHLLEINLRGGLRGSRFDQRRYLEAVEATHQRLLRRVLAG